jgi:hypothetical protein
MVVSAISPAELKALEDALLNTTGKVPLHDRFRALFALKSLKNDDAVAIISKGAIFFIHGILQFYRTLSRYRKALMIPLPC